MGTSPLEPWEIKTVQWNNGVLTPWSFNFIDLTPLLSVLEMADYLFLTGFPGYPDLKGWNSPCLNWKDSLSPIMKSGVEPMCTAWHHLSSQNTVHTPKLLWITQLRISKRLSILALSGKWKNDEPYEGNTFLSACTLRRFFSFDFSETFPLRLQKEMAVVAEKEIPKKENWGRRGRKRRQEVDRTLNRREQAGVEQQNHKPQKNFLGQRQWQAADPTLPHNPQWEEVAFFCGFVCLLL